MLKNSNLIQDTTLPVTFFIKTVQKHLLAYPTAFHLSSNLCVLIPEKGSKNRALRRMSVIMAWFHSCKALKPPHYSQSHRIEDLYNRSQRFEEQFFI